MKSIQEMLEIGNSFDIINVKFFDGEKVLHATRICVRDGWITEVITTPSAKNDNVREIEGAGKFLMPSLIDYEGHFSTPNDMMLGLVSSKNPFVREQLSKLMEKGELYEIDTHGLNLYRGINPSCMGEKNNIPPSANFEKHIRFGVTTVIDQAAYPWPANYIRRSRNKWKESDPIDLRKEFLIYADLYTSGMWATPVGLNFGYFGMDPVYDHWSEKDYASWVERRMAESSDHIKVFYEAWGNPTAPRISLAGLKAITKAAHARDLKVIVHDGVALDDLIDAKVDGSIHTPENPNGGAIEMEAAQRFAKTVRVVTPTMSISLSRTNIPVSIAAASIAKDFLTAETLPYMNALDELRLRGGDRVAANPNVHLTYFETVAKLCDAGALLTLGSDSGTFGPFIEGLTLHHEMFLISEAIKMFSKKDPIIEALKAGTSNPAIAYELDLGSKVGDPRGFIRPGYRADLLLLNADPTVDIKNTMKIDSVFKAGYLANRKVVRTL
jgi:alpha-D-ribose 1-methylphosphonate 5-triphosphate diphosphatase PhnM